jgi:hypothetical protein
MNKKRPVIITIIGDISILAALLSIGVSAFPDFFERLGFQLTSLPVYSNRVMHILLSIILIIASVGLLKLKRWGYWLMVIYNTFFLLVNVIWCLQNKQFPFSLSIIFTVIILVDILSYRKYFT